MNDLAGWIDEKLTVLRAEEAQWLANVNASKGAILILEQAKIEAAKVPDAEHKRANPRK